MIFWHRLFAVIKTKKYHKIEISGVIIYPDNVSCKKRET